MTILTNREIQRVLFRRERSSDQIGAIREELAKDKATARREGRSQQSVTSKWMTSIRDALKAKDKTKDMRKSCRELLFGVKKVEPTKVETKPYMPSGRPPPGQHKEEEHKSSIFQDLMQAKAVEKVVDKLKLKGLLTRMGGLLGKLGKMGGAAAGGIEGAISAFLPGLLSVLAKGMPILAVAAAGAIGYKLGDWFYNEVLSDDLKGKIFDYIEKPFEKIGQFLTWVQDKWANIYSGVLGKFGMGKDRNERSQEQINADLNKRGQRVIGDKEKEQGFVMLEDKNTGAMKKVPLDASLKVGDTVSRTFEGKPPEVAKKVDRLGDRERATLIENEVTAKFKPPTVSDTALVDPATLKGTRTKQQFDGKGGEALTKYGTYTDEEANKIRELRASGANTSANVTGGMSPEIRDKIIMYSEKYGLDPQRMLKMAAMESGGNPNAVSATGASGVYQFTGQTATGVGIKNRFDADQNIAGGMELTKRNVEMMKRQGIEPTAENIYMYHQLGPKAASEVIQAAQQGQDISSLSKSTQEAVRLNYGANSKTAQEYVQTNATALDKRYASVVKGGDEAIATARAGTPVMPGAKPTETTVATKAPEPGKTPEQIAYAAKVAGAQKALQSPTMTATPGAVSTPDQAAYAAKLAEAQRALREPVAATVTPQMQMANVGKPQPSADDLAWAKIDPEAAARVAAAKAPAARGTPTTYQDSSIEPSPFKPPITELPAPTPPSGPTVIAGAQAGSGRNTADQMPMMVDNFGLVVMNSTMMGY
jgi:hypothetical protein